MIDKEIHIILNPIAGARKATKILPELKSLFANKNLQYYNPSH